MDQKELTEIFRKLGAEDPEDWARSQIREGIPQLARFLFLREAWRSIGGLHESVIEMDPTGREMRPRGTG